MSTHLDTFKSHIDIIRGMGYQIVREFSGNDKEIRIGFDDGFRGVYENKEFFLTNHIPVTIFIPTSLVNSYGYLTMEEIIELERLGFNIQSHGVRHKDMTKMDITTLKDDLTTSKKFLETLLCKPIDEICFPMGYFSDQVIEESLNSGYTLLFSSMPSPSKKFPKNLLGRIFLQPLTNIQVKLSILSRQMALQAHYKSLHYKQKTI